MSFWQELLNRICPHRFSWPRIDDNDRHYQVCLLCGTAYEYDWKTMCRTNRIVILSVPYVSEDNRLSGPGPGFPKQPGQ